MAHGVLARHLTRRTLLKSTALGAFAITAAGCNVVPGLGAKQKMLVWTDPTFAPASDDYQTKVMEDWAKAKGVEIEITREAVDQKLQAAVESKQVPDISQMDTGRTIKYRTSGLVHDVSDLFADVGRQWGGWYKPAERIATKDGKQWVMPYSIDSSLILYRNDILQEGGVKEFPKTWSEMFDTIKRLQKPPDLYGAGFQFNKAGTDAEGTFGMMAFSYGASIVKEDSKTINIKTEPMKQFLTELKRSWDLGIYPPGVTGWDNASNNTSLQDGKTILIHNPASPLVWFRNNKPEMLQKIGIAATPAGPTGKSFNSAYLRDGFAIMATGDSKRVDLSRDLVKQLYSKEVYRNWIGLAFPAPAVAGMEDHEVWKNPQRKGFLDAAKTGVLDGYPGEPTDAYTELGTRLPFLTMAIRLVVDKWSIDQAIDEADKIARDVYSKYYK
ncbi:MAG TPA: extracellular solute-binding protein [Chloroflexota bacterium]|jgi:multiple sugar transport system substrate-binding protein|nr:extracellular solute-binding protein [Chloroflexota bacterium]